MEGTRQRGVPTKRTEELTRQGNCRLNCELPLYLREALKTQAAAEDIHLTQLVRRYMRAGLKQAGWDV